MPAVSVHGGTYKQAEAGARLPFLIVSTLTAIVALAVFATAHSERPPLDTDRTLLTPEMRHEVNPMPVALPIVTPWPSQPPASPAELKEREERAASMQFLGQLEYAILTNDAKMFTRSSP